MLRNCVLVSCLLAATTVAAQNRPYDRRNQRRMPEIPKENLNTSGVIKGLAPGGFIHLVTEEGEQWIVKVEAMPSSIYYYAEAEASWLRPGMIVEFQGQFDEKGQAHSEIRDLAVITPREDTKFGITAETGLIAGSGSFFSEAATEPAKPKPKLVGINVVGALGGVKGNALVVSAGQAKLKAPLSEKAKISVNLASLSLTRVGDSVEIQGWYVKGQKGRAIANQVTVRAKEPLKMAAAKPRAVAKTEGGDAQADPQDKKKPEPKKPEPKKPEPKKPAADPLEELP